MNGVAWVSHETLFEKNNRRYGRQYESVAAVLSSTAGDGGGSAVRFSGASDARDRGDGNERQNDRGEFDYGFDAGGGTSCGDGVDGEFSRG